MKIRPKIKCRFFNLWCRLLYLFRPATVLLVCLVAAVVVDIICVMILRSGVTDLGASISTAVATGVTASALVVVLTEVADNYRNNRKRWIVLSDLYGFLQEYEMRVQMDTGDFDQMTESIDFEKKQHQKLVRRGGESQEDADAAIKASVEEWEEIRKLDEDEEDFDFIDRPDRKCAVYNLLPELITLVGKIYDANKNLLSPTELQLFENILRDYHFIIRMIKETMHIKPDIRFGSVYKEQTENLIDWMPKQLKTVLTDAALMELTVSSWEQYMEKAAEEIFKCGARALDNIGIPFMGVDRQGSVK